MIYHIDFNSFFASVEQQANPKLRGKPVGVTGGDRPTRTVLAAASVEAKKFAVKTGMQLWEACRLCPKIIIVPGDSDKYLAITTCFLNILKDYSPYLEVFSIDEAFMELPSSTSPIVLAQEIKSRIRAEIGEWIKCSIGISYNKLLAKLAGSLQKPDGLVVIPDQKTAIQVLDKAPLDTICGIGSRIKHRLNQMGIFNFKQLRQVPLSILLFHFKSYGNFLYNAARGVDHSPLVPFYEREEVKSIGHRHTTLHDTDSPEEIRQILLKLCELIAIRLRAKNLVGKTIHCWYREGANLFHLSFSGDGMPASRGEQATVPYTNDGLEIFNAAWKIFQNIWNGGLIRMIGASVSNLKPTAPTNLSLLQNIAKKELLNKLTDQINQKHGDFTLKRAVLLNSQPMHRKPNPYLADRRFKL